MTTQMIFPELEGELPLPLQVAKQWQFPLDYHVDKDGKYWFAVSDWLRGLTQKEDVRKLWSDIQVQ